MQFHLSTLRTASVVVVLLGGTAGAAQAETLRVGGTGAATQMLQRLGAAFTARDPGTTLEVMPSLGSTGGIAAVADGAIDFAVSGRPLKPEEAKSLTATVLATTPFGLASSNANPGSIKRADIAAFYRNVASSWPDGTPVRVVLRPTSESDNALLADAFPGFAAAVEQLRQRKEIPVAATDQDNVITAEKTAGSLIGVSLTQLLTEKPDLHFLAIDGVLPTLENFERGSYPYRKDFHFVFSSREAPAVARFIAFLRSPDGERVLRETGNLAPRP